MELQNNNHSVFAIHFHLILVTKYRRKVIDNTINNKARLIFLKIAPSYNSSVEEWNFEEDHIHRLFSSHPNSNISKFINAYKSASSRLIKKEFPEIRQHLWKEHFWSRSFCLISCGGASIETHCIIGAGALITEGMHIPKGSVVVGIPGKIVKNISEQQIALIHKNALHYRDLVKTYKKEK